MKKLLLIFGVLFSYYSGAQENTANHWYFGINSGISFSTGMAKGILGGQITGLEGCATVGDMSGNLLFYTDGQVIYDCNHEVMQNGEGILGHWSSSQSSIIIKKPGSSTQYYVFTTDAAEHHLVNNWRYSIVDMSLNWGLGAVTEVKNVILEDAVTEKQIAVMHQNNVNVWIIGHRWNSNEFVAYEITPEGINSTPVVSAIGVVHQGGYSPNPDYNNWANAAGAMKTNKDGNKIALAIHKMGIYELFNFDKSSGVVSNCRTSQTYENVYGVEFSPDGTKLYATCDIYTTSRLFQFNLSQSNPFSNPVTISMESSHQNQGMQLGPNAKIYVTRYEGEYIAVINDPDSLGYACNYESNAVYLLGETGRRSLPSIFFYKGFEFFTGSEQTISICDGDSIFLQNAWQYNEGDFVDTLNSSQSWDSIVTTHLILIPAPEQPLITEVNGVLYCETTAQNYQWYRNGVPIAGAIAPLYQPFISGNYSVEVYEDNSQCHVFSDEYIFIYLTVEPNLLNQPVILPNPILNSFTVEFEGNCHLFLIDVHGGICYESKHQQGLSQHNVFQLPSGIYILKMINDNFVWHTKIIKE